MAHVDLEVPSSEVLLLAGANGSGKTTLLRTFAGLLRPTRGQLEIHGASPYGRRRESRHLVSLVSHQSYLYPQLTARETVRLWASLLGRPLSVADAGDLLAEVSLAERAQDLVLGFSAGMRKRLSLLRTRLEQPRVVLLDEPFAALDPPGQQLIEDWIASFRERNLTVVMASHSLARAARLSDRAVVLRHGQVHWIGPACEVQEHFA